MAAPADSYHLNTSLRTKMPMPMSKSSTTMRNRAIVLFSVGEEQSAVTARRSRREGGPKGKPPPSLPERSRLGQLQPLHLGHQLSTPPGAV
jgi:hypothetical protein